MKASAPVTGPDGNNPITDEQIREMLDDKDPLKPRLPIEERAWCIAALRIPVGKLIKVNRHEARERCADIWNARHARHARHGGAP